MNLQLIRAIAVKELRDGVRDRRSLASALLFPLFGPILLMAMLGYVTETRSQESDLELAVSGMNHAPALIEFLEDAGVQISPAPPLEEAEAAVQEGTLDVVLVIGEDFGEAFRSGQPAPLTLIVDESRTASLTPIRRTERVLDAWSSRLAALRLIARGVDPRLVQPLDIERMDLATPEKRAARLLDSVPMFVILAAFVCTMYIAIDTTAGERERGSLEPLLLNPVPPLSLVIGKWLATVSFGIGGVVLTIVLSLASLTQVPLEQLGLRAQLHLGQGLAMAAAAVPLALLAGAAQLAVSTFSRSFKEAQTWLSLLMFVPMMPGLWLSLSPVKPALWMMFVPVLGQSVLVSQELRGESMGPAAMGLAAAVAVGAALLLVWLTSKLFQRERIIFGR